MRFTPLIETTPEPAPEVILTYDTSCLPPAIPTPEPTPIPPQEEPPDILIQIPPLEGEFLEVETGELNEPEQPEEQFEERILIHVDYPASSATYGIYSADPTTGDVTPLLRGLNLISNVILSPDGRYIAFSGFIFESQITNNGLFVMKSDGSDLRQIGIPGTAYGSVGWTADSQYVTYRVGSENKTYGQRPNPLPTDEPIELLEEGINPKWIDMGVNKVIYTSNGYLYVASFDPITLQIEDDPTQITTTPVGRYAWANQGRDIIFEENGQLWYYRDEVVSLTETTAEEPIGHLSWMTTPLGFDFVTVKPEGGGTIISGGIINPIPYNYQIQRIRFGGSSTIQFAQPVLDFGNLFYPFLSPYRNNDQDIYYVSCGSVSPPTPEQCTESYILDASSSVPRRIFDDTPIDGSPVVAWQEMLIPVECPPPANLAGTMSTTQSSIPEICQEPPPSEECSAQINPEATGAYRLRKIPINGDEILSIDKGTAIFIRGINADFTWYYIRYNDSSTDYFGWVASEGVSDVQPACDIPLLGVNENNEPIEIDIVYDYDLQIPQPPWLPEIPLEERSLADWRTKGREENDNTAEKWAYDHCLGIENDKEDWQNCTLIVYVIYYDIFIRINGRVPRLSDIFATTYSVEVFPAVGQAGPDIALEALTGNYFGVVRAYCEYLGLSTDIPENCDNKDFLINDLVHGYENLDDLQNSSTEKNGGYLWTLQAWYKEAVLIRDWYFDLTDDQLDEINTLTDISNPRINILLQAADDYQTLGIAQLTEGKENSRFLKWANFAFGYTDDNGINGYERIISEETNNTGTIEYCLMNLYFYGINESRPGGEDLFVVTTIGLGQPSTHDQREAGIPVWTYNAEYTANAGFIALGTYDYLSCNCLKDDGTRYPSESDERCRKGQTQP